MLPSLFLQRVHVDGRYTQEIPAKSINLVTTVLDNTPQCIADRFPCLTSSPGHVPPLSPPNEKQGGRWISGTVTAITALPLPPTIVPLQ